MYNHLDCHTEYQLFHPALASCWAGAVARLQWTLTNRRKSTECIGKNTVYIRQLVNVHCIFVSWWKISMKFYYLLHKKAVKDSLVRLEMSYTSCCFHLCQSIKIFFMYERLLLLTVRWIFGIVERQVGEIRVRLHISLNTTLHYIRSMKLRNIATIKSIII